MPAALDLSFCGDQELKPILTELLVKMKATHASVYEMARGADVNTHPPILKELNLPSKAVVIEEKEESEEVLHDIDQNVSDKVHLKELLLGKSSCHWIVDQESIPRYSSRRGKGFTVYLNEQLQFSSLDERNYHEALVFPAMESAASHERTLTIFRGREWVESFTGSA